MCQITDMRGGNAIMLRMGQRREFAIWTLWVLVLVLMMPCARADIFTNKKTGEVLTGRWVQDTKIEGKDVMFVRIGPSGSRFLPKDEWTREKEKPEQSGKATDDHKVKSKPVESPLSLKVGNGTLRVEFKFTTLYIPSCPDHERRLGYSRFFFITYREDGSNADSKPVAGYFRINGKAEKLAIRSSDKGVIAEYGKLPTAAELLPGKKIPDKSPLSSNLNYIDGHD
jgi:hypothetical protein